MRETGNDFDPHWQTHFYCKNIGKHLKPFGAVAQIPWLLEHNNEHIIQIKISKT